MNKRLALVIGVLVVLGGVGAVLVWRSVPSSTPSDTTPSTQGKVDAGAPPRKPRAEEPVPADPFAHKVYVALGKTRSYLAKAPRLGQDAVWLLRYLDEGRYDLALDDAVDRARAKASGLVNTPLFVQADAERPKAPEKLGDSPLMRMINAVVSSMGVPDERAIQNLRDYTQKPGTGYELTHQFLVLQWYEEFGRKLPPDLVERRAELLARVSQEQKESTEMSDLYSERAMILSLFSDKRCPEGLEKWVTTLVETQQPDGSWGEEKFEAEIGGVKLPSQTAAHTAVLAVAPMRRFLECHFEQSGH